MPIKFINFSAIEFDATNTDPFKEMRFILYKQGKSNDYKLVGVSKKNWSNQGGIKNLGKIIAIFNETKWDVSQAPTANKIGKRLRDAAIKHNSSKWHCLTCLFFSLISKILKHPFQHYNSSFTVNLPTNQDQPSNTEKTGLGINALPNIQEQPKELEKLPPYDDPKIDLKNRLQDRIKAFIRDIENLNNQRKNDESKNIDEINPDIKKYSDKLLTVKENIQKYQRELSEEKSSEKKQKLEKDLEKAEFSRNLYSNRLEDEKSRAEETIKRQIKSHDFYQSAREESFLNELILYKNLGLDNPSIYNVLHPYFTDYPQLANIFTKFNAV
jgi:hypothetical protein